MSTDFSLDGDETIAIRKHMTIGDIFEGSTGQLQAFADSVKIFADDGSTSSLFWDGVKWTADFVSDNSARPVYPGNGFIAAFGGSVDVTLTGSVKATATKVPVYAGVLNFVTAIAPSDTTVGDLDLVSVLVPFSENIKVLSQDGGVDRNSFIFH
jgi:hypothetical protein